MVHMAIAWSYHSYHNTAQLLMESLSARLVPAGAEVHPTLRGGCMRSKYPAMILHIITMATVNHDTVSMAMLTKCF